jgi:hypothetical protein
MYKLYKPPTPLLQYLAASTFPGGPSVFPHLCLSLLLSASKTPFQNILKFLFQNFSFFRLETGRTPFLWHINGPLALPFGNRSLFLLLGSTQFLVDLYKRDSFFSSLPLRRNKFLLALSWKK